MNTILDKLGYLCAIVGFLFCAFAGGVRLAGMFSILSFEAITLLQGGIALMVFACMIRLYFPVSSN